MSVGQLKKIGLILSDEMSVFHKSVHSEDVTFVKFPGAMISNPRKRQYKIIHSSSIIRAQKNFLYLVSASQYGEHHSFPVPQGISNIL